MSRVRQLEYEHEPFVAATPSPAPPALSPAMYALARTAATRPVAPVARFRPPVAPLLARKKSPGFGSVCSGIGTVEEKAGENLTAEQRENLKDAQAACETANATFNPAGVKDMLVDTSKAAAKEAAKAEVEGRDPGVAALKGCAADGSGMAQKVCWDGLRKLAGEGNKEAQDAAQEIQKDPKGVVRLENRVETELDKRREAADEKEAAKQELPPQESSEANQPVNQSTPEHGDQGADVSISKGTLDDEQTKREDAEQREIEEQGKAAEPKTTIQVGPDGQVREVDAEKAQRAKDEASAGATHRVTADGKIEPIDHGDGPNQSVDPSQEPARETQANEAPAPFDSEPTSSQPEPTPAGPQSLPDESGGDASGGGE